MDINIEKLKSICLDFFTLTGMQFSLWDENEKIIFSYPEILSGFCKVVRQKNELYKNCRKCDSFGLSQVKKTKKPFIYRCHTGLTETIVPIMQNDEIVGYLMAGQICEEENIEEITQIINQIDADRPFKKQLIDSLSCAISCTHDKVIQSMNIMSVLIDYMNLSYVITTNTENVFYKIRRFINDNLSSPTLPRDICTKIGISQSTLYKTIKSNTNVSPSEFIRQIKINESKRLIKETSKSISQIAEAVGISDVNYFIRIFKKEVGISPLNYRKTDNNQYPS